MTTFNIGIDTGGTYTDAVIIDMTNRQVIAAAKSITTKGQLEIGVNRALTEVIEVSKIQSSSHNIGLVSLSTTLATNALVEGTGSSVAAILIGFSDDMVLRSNLRDAIPAARIIQIKGGHNYDGHETEPLDEASLIDFLDEMGDSAEAYSVSSNYSVRNPAHERRVMEIIHQKVNRPVSISSDLSDGLNGPGRALTATFNVRIVSLILSLVNSVSAAMREHQIDAPLMIVKGDGSVASAASVIDKPIETILSGPAASVIGANFISNLSNFIISDVGGTTTDVAIVKNGWPALNEKGAMAGNYRTMVKAIDMQTIGLGGDSEVSIDHRGIVELKNNRVVPISLLCHHHPKTIDTLKASLADGMGLSRAIKFIFLPEGSSHRPTPPGLSEADLAFLAQVTEEPQGFDNVVVRASDRARAGRLLDRGIVQVSGITPSDAAHVLGLQSQWSVEGATLGCHLFGRSHGLIDWKQKENDHLVKQFAQSIFKIMVGKSTQVLINQLSGQKFSAKDALVNAVSFGDSHLNDLNIQVKSTMPVVAVGGPAQIFYPAVGERLGVKTVIPEHCDVANAVGAAIGQIKINCSIEITRSEAGGYLAHDNEQPRGFSSSSEALEYAKNSAESQARTHAIQMGGTNVEINTEIERVDLPNMDKEMSLIGATVTAICLSSPGLQTA
jgi:N-methylhydantoinase A/oxoprolinase/acetone carboxylase beta subunit